MLCYIDKNTPRSCGGRVVKKIEALVYGVPRKIIREENNKVIKIVSDDIFINSKLKVPIQCDGEFIGCLPVQIKKTKKTINLLVKEEKSKTKSKK